MYLSDLKLNERALIKKINLKGNIKTRLQDMGFIKNNEITCVLESPFKDPKAYLINNTMLAIRNKDALEIEVESVA